jgi:phosphate transport system ATP-binding protein
MKKIKVKHLNVYYGDNQVLKDINIDIKEHNIIALIGASGCGKSTFLRCINRMNDLIDIAKIEGSIFVDSEDIYAEHVDAVSVRKRIGMVFQQPNPFPKTIYDNIAHAPLLHNLVKKGKECDDLVVSCLKSVNLYDEVKNNLNVLGTSLSGGQQQRLCIARTIAIKPDIILMDEPTSALDPLSTAKIEELMINLKKDYTIVVVTHNMQQANRISDYTAFFHLGELLEYGKTNDFFIKPSRKKTQDYINGKFG